MAIYDIVGGKRIMSLQCPPALSACLLLAIERPAEPALRAEALARWMPFR
jgi:hypothetical protein